METTQLFETLRLWLELEPRELLLYGGPLKPYREDCRELEPRVMALISALHHLRVCGESRRLIAPMHEPRRHPLRDGWRDPDRHDRLKSLLRRMAAGSTALHWLDADPDRWQELLEAARWPDGTSDARMAVISHLREDPRTVSLPAGLLADRLAAALLTAPMASELRMRMLDRDTLDGLIGECHRSLWQWGQQQAPLRRKMRVSALPLPVQRALRGEGGEAAALLMLDGPTHPGEFPSQLLRSAREIVPFQGCSESFSAMLRWCSAPEPGAVRLLTGPAGAGKTRLLRELCHLLRSQGWAAGFATDEQADAVATAHGDRLVVVDDAERRADVLAALLRAPGAGRLRVVALSRAEGGWWRSIVADSPLPSASQPLSPIPCQDRIPRLKLAAAAFADAQGVRIPWVMGVPDLERTCWPLDLQVAALLSLQGRSAASTDNVGRLLEVERRAWHRAGHDPAELAKALAGCALYGDAAAVPYGPDGLRPDALSDRLLEEVLSEDDSPDLLTRDVDADAICRATAALLRLSERTAEARSWLRTLLEVDIDTRAPIALRAARQVARRPQATPLGPVLSALGALPTGEQLNLPEPIRWVNLALSHKVMASWSVREPGDPPPAVAIAVNSGHGSGTRATGQWRASEPPLAEQVWEVVRQRANVLLPHQIRALELLDQDAESHPLACQRVALTFELCAETSMSTHLELAINDLGTQLCAAQRSGEPPVLSRASREQLSEALSILQDACALRNRPRSVDALGEAIGALQRIARLPALSIDPALIRAAAELITRSQAIGRHQDAADVLAGFIPPLQQLIEGSAPRWPTQSSLLCNLALLHLIEDRTDRAEVAATEAVAVADARSAQAPIDHLSALHVLALVRDVREESCVAGILQNAVGILAALADDKPELFCPCLAAAQDAIGRWGSGEMRRDGLLQAAITLGHLHDQRPDLYAPFLGISLHNLGAKLRILGAESAAVDATLDAVASYRRQARLSGETFLPDLTSALSNLGVMLAASARLPEAMTLTRKAIGVSWGGVPQEALARMPRVESLLTRTSPDPISRPASLALRARLQVAPTRRRPYFLWSLSLLAGELGREHEDEEISASISRIWRQHHTDPLELRPQLALALHNLGSVLGLAGHLEDAAQAIDGAAAVLRTLSAEQPVDFAPELAAALDSLSALRGLAGASDQALAASEEAVSLLRTLSTSHPAMGTELAAALINLTAALSALGCHAQAAEASAEAASLLRERDEPAAMAAAMYNRGLSLAAAGSADAAILSVASALREASPTHRVEMLRGYRQVCHELARPVDAALIATLQG